MSDQWINNTCSQFLLWHFNGKATMWHKNIIAWLHCCLHGDGSGDVRNIFLAHLGPLVLTENYLNCTAYMSAVSLFMTTVYPSSDCFLQDNVPQRSDHLRLVSWTWWDSYHGNIHQLNYNKMSHVLHNIHFFFQGREWYSFIHIFLNYSSFLII